MDPSVVAAISGALMALATEVGVGAARQAGQDAWKRVKAVLGPKPGVALYEVQALLADRLTSNPEIARQLLELLKSSDSTSVGQLVGTIDADKVIVADTITGDINM